MIAHANRWAVLYCLSTQAPTLVERLTGLGGAVYYPMMTRKRRIPRRTARTTVKVAAFPGYVFAAWSGRQSCADLWRRVMVPARILAVDGEALTMPRERLVRLQEAEERWAAPDRSPANFVPAPGARVRFCLGPFEGMHAAVLKADAFTARVELEALNAPVTTPTEALVAAD